MPALVALLLETIVALGISSPTPDLAELVNAPERLVSHSAVNVGVDFCPLKRAQPVRTLVLLPEEPGEPVGDVCRMYAGCIRDRYTAAPRPRRPLYRTVHTGTSPPSISV